MNGTLPGLQTGYAGTVASNPARARVTEQPVCVAATHNDEGIADIWGIELELENSIKDSCLHAYL